MDPPRVVISSQNELSSIVIGTQPTGILSDQGVAACPPTSIGSNFKNGYLPFRLSLQQIPSAAAILAKKPEMYQALLDMKRSKLEHSSFKTYNNIIKHFSEFCKQENINIMQFSEQDVVLYLYFIKRPPVKKAVPFKQLELRKMFDQVLGQNFETVQHFNLIDIRSLLRAVIIYWTWIRFDDYKQITDQFVFDCNTYVKITFPQSKNENYAHNHF